MSIYISLYQCIELLTIKLYQYTFKKNNINIVLELYFHHKYVCLYKQCAIMITKIKWTNFNIIVYF